jgi:hypothetical protein
MAKDRHRIFEIYEERDEAAWELMPKGNKVAAGAAPPETWSMSQVEVSVLAGITQVRFKEPTLTSNEVIGELKDDFTQLGEKLGTNGKALLDFTGVQEVSTAAVSLLIGFNKKLQVKGSRMVLCCLEPNVRSAIFTDY